ncbi:chemotaxis protein CheX [Planctomicrobium sp. SH664]|uniref:chemotaxis protein CheX n=1 Tax=Planctomicrobium sp. SH664 TaxID=3448125 RepID=UPI003F5C2C6C
MEVDNTQLEQIAIDVLTGMLGLKVEPVRNYATTQSSLVSSIQISGDWKAGLEVETPLRGARQIAEQMFGLSGDDLAEAEIADALGEIVNMIGGNIKGLSQGETILSLPCAGPALDAPGETAVRPTELHLRVGEEMLSLRLQQHAVGSVPAESH